VTQPASSPETQLALRFQGSRPGWDLVAVVDAAIPVTRIAADVLALDRKRLPPLDEFILRLVGEGVTTIDELTGYLGLPESIVADAVASQFSSDNLTYRQQGNGKKMLELTGRGRVTAQELASITPVQAELKLIFDRLLWRIRPYDDNQTISQGHAQREEILRLPALRSTKIESADVKPAQINALIRNRADSEREVLAVKAVREQPTKRMMPAKVLVYSDPARKEVQLAVVVDDELVEEHEMNLLSLGGAERLGIKAEPSEPRPKLSDELEQVRVPVSEVTNRQSEEIAAHGIGEPPAPASGMVVRGVSVFEHPDLLNQALTTASRRILLISPWIRRNVVDTAFIGKLEQRLRRSVMVNIAYGIDPVDPESDERAVNQLKNLAARYSDLFTFTRLRRTHAKVLIFDDIWINTSFNWMSFKGDSNRTYRMEEGTLVQNSELVDSQYQHYLSLIEEKKLIE
jgi:hypothetical protein